MVAGADQRLHPLPPPARPRLCRFRRPHEFKVGNPFGVIAPARLPYRAGWIQPVAAGTVEELLERYRNHLVVKCGLARTTVIKYEHLARLFLGKQWTAGDGAVLEMLDGAVVTTFIGHECHNCSAGTAKNRVK